MIAIKYSFFAIISIGFNLVSQLICFSIYVGVGRLYVAMFVGTISGLVCKYILDKRYIFYDFPKTKADDAKKFIAYSFTGGITTIIFWGAELSAEEFFEYENSKYIGATIGLCVGYVIKYHLDKKYVFDVGKW